jgi:hypothetical protein
MAKRLSSLRAIAFCASVLMSTPALAQEATDPDEAVRQAELAKQSQNPVANMISVPLELWYSDGENGHAFTAITKPVIPASLGKINLINRFIVPFVSVDGAMQPPNQAIDGPVVNASGLANITYQGFLSPAQPGKVIWGLGAALEMPTATDDQLGADRWSAGPSVLALMKPGAWVLAVLVQNVWDFAGSGDETVNRLTLQPIVNLNLNKGWYLTSAPVITANWDANEGNKWTVPIGAGVGKLHRFGKQPVDFKLVYYYNVEKPTIGADWSLLFSVKLLFPK